jgi:putative tryptophan/tyrosine transport system substrate-binding protein
MRRRAFTGFVGVLIAWPLVARALEPARPHRILWVSTQSQPDPFLDGFREGMRAQGYVEGKNFVFELRYAQGDPAALQQMVSQLRRGDIDLAVSSGPATRAMVSITDIPVLFALSGDPIALGVVKSLAQPGTNFTGATFLSLELAGKRVELLKDVYPALRKLAVLSNRDHPGEQSEWQATQQVLRTKLAQFAVTNRLPSMFGWSEYCEAGGLLSYGANQRATYFWLANYADRILRGESPAALPVVQPDKFELVLNLKTARLLGLSLDISSILFRADKVIE